MRLCHRAVGLTLLGLLASTAVLGARQVEKGAERPARLTQYTPGTQEPPLPGSPSAPPAVPPPSQPVPPPPTAPAQAQPVPPPPPPPPPEAVPPVQIAPAVAAPPEAAEPPVPVVVIRVRVVACASADQEIEYCICVENTSPAAAHHVLVRDPLPANTRFVRASPAPTKTEPELQWYLGTLPGLCSREIVLVLHPTNDEDVKNCARVQFEYGQCVCTRLARASPVPPGVQPTTPGGASGGQPTPPGAPGTSPEKTAPTPAGQARLQLTATGPRAEVVNQPVTYTITLTNTGSAAANNTLITATLPPLTTFVSATANGQHAANQVAWTQKSLQPGASQTVEVTLKAQAAGTHCVQATALADGDLTAKAEACTVFKGAVGLGVRVETTKNPVAVGGETRYVVVVENQGSLPATNIRIRTTVPNELEVVNVDGPYDKLGERLKEGQALDFNVIAQLAPGAKETRQISVRALRPGEARFRATITADQLPAGPVINEQSTTIYAEDGPGQP